jgi:alpha-methylacyl-CoA racemase
MLSILLTIDRSPSTVTCMSANTQDPGASQVPPNPQQQRAGPLAGNRIIEFAGIGPGPFAAMLLADMGADIIRIDRIGTATASFDVDPELDILSRNRRSIALDLKTSGGRDVVLRLCATATALIEGFRPGVMERLGLGPETCLRANPALVYGRITGWGQTGPLSRSAGHDINYIALSGCLHGIGRAGEPPVPPINLVGDYGGGAMFLVTGILAGVIHARATGQGQVVDAAILDGAALFLAPFMGLRTMGFWNDERGTNLLDGGAYFYDCYPTRDGEYLSIGALEPRFFAELLRIAGLDSGTYTQSDPAQWPTLRARLAEVIVRRGRDEWMMLFGAADACVAPVLSMEEAPRHPHNMARETFISRFGTLQPAPAPRFSETPGSIRSPPPRIGAQTRTILSELGIPAPQIDDLLRAGACAEPAPAAPPQDAHGT